MSVTMLVAIGFAPSINRSRVIVTTEAANASPGPPQACVMALQTKIAGQA